MVIERRSVRVRSCCLLESLSVWGETQANIEKETQEIGLHPTPSPTLMSTPLSNPKLDQSKNPKSVRTRSQPRKISSSTANKTEINSDGASPLLRGRKRKSSGISTTAPPSKRMADNEILAAINDVGKSVVAMEKQLKNCCTKEDMSKMTKEIRGEVLKNSQRIDTLFEMRKNDAPLLAKRVEMIVDRHIAKKGNGRGALSSEEPFEQDYLLSRRSVRLWPIPAGINLEEQVRQFFYTILSIPEAVSKTIGIDSVQRMVQPRRSKITGEVLVRFTSTQDRDTVQSYAPNLAGIEGKAGLRLDIPEHLRGTFRQFESLAALLRRRHGQVK